MFLGTLYTVIAIPLIRIRPPKYDSTAIVSLNKINARIKIDGVYMVDTNADILDPILFKDSKKNTSAMVIPKTPLIISTVNSSKENFGMGIEKTIIVIMNPPTPIKFLIALSCKDPNFFDEISKKMTAEAQQKAVKTA
jgi:hypothetical protein